MTGSPLNMLSGNCPIGSDQENDTRVGRTTRSVSLEKNSAKHKELRVSSAK